MKLLNTKTETKIVETSLYEIEGVDPFHAVLETVTITCGAETSTVSSIKKTLEGKDYKNYRPLFVNPNFFEIIKTENPFQADRNKVFSEYQSSLENLNNVGLVWVCFSDHTLLDSGLTPLPFCRSYDYVSTFLSNKYIDLNDKFLEWLRNHPWVVNKDGVRVEEIPYYNQDDDSTHYVEVSIYPDKETYVEVVKYLKERPGRYLNISEVLVGSPCCPKDTPDWFGIRPWLRNPLP